MVRITSILWILSLALPSTAFADYTRMWRGYAGEAFAEDHPSFVAELNRVLLPATGELAHTPANLRAYLPVVLPVDLWEVGLPAETALLIYGSEDGYRDYRATAAGQHYGDLHFPLFDRKTSQSRVPQQSKTGLAYGDAYTIVAGDITATDGKAYARVLLPRTDEEFLTSLERHVQATQMSELNAYFLLVEESYAIEYVNFAAGKSGSELEVWSTPLAIGKTLSAGSGVIFDLADAGAPTVRATWERHIQAWSDRDLDAIVADYHEASIVIRNDEIYVGKAEIRALFADLFAHFDRIEASQIDRITIIDNTVHLLWQGTSGATFQGTDTFTIRNNRIDAQTITAPAEFWYR